MKTIKHCQTFSWKFTLAVLSFCIMQLISNGQSVQSRFWYTGDNIIDMSSYTTPVITPTNESPSQFVSNGAYWTNGSINETEFFVSDNTVFQDDGMGSLAQSQMYSILNTGPNSSIISSEVGVCPKPGSCDSFYIFYGHKYYHNGNGCSAYELKYHLVDRNTLSDPNFNYGVVEYDNTVFTRNLTNHCPSTIPMAASREKLINGVKTRQLYYLEFDNTNYKLMRIDITYTSVSSPVVLYTHTDGLFYSTFELELSPDGTKLAFGQSGDNVSNNTDPLKDIYMYHLNATTGALNTNLGTGGLTTINLPGGPTGGYPFERIIGLEFTPGGDRLFASRAQDKIYYISNFTSSPPTILNLGVSSADYTFSQMELVSNGGQDYIAVAKNENEVYRIYDINGSTPLTNAFYSNAKVPQHHSYPISSGPSSTINLLCLPDQVDGDNYTGSAGGWFDPK